MEQNEQQITREMSTGGTIKFNLDKLRDLAEVGELERDARAGIRRLESLTTEVEDVSEVEYRKVRLERVILVGITEGQTKEKAYNSLLELKALADTAGCSVLDLVLQSRAKCDPVTYLGAGKARDLAKLVEEKQADTVIVNGEMTPSQRRELEEIVKVKVVERVALILDIFAQHAKSKEGKAQVELAQLEYLLPRLRGWGYSMSRQAGGRVSAGLGIGSRGPGETKLELDRRRIHSRISKLKREIAKMKKSRSLRRADRRRHQIPSVVIVGYTNAGKTTLLNALAEANGMVEDALFATLDPLTRRCFVGSREFTLSDTVGFVANLPTQLVEAFRSTLEEIEEADLILNVVDGSSPDPVEQYQTVQEILMDLPGVSAIPQLIAINKVDLLDNLQMLYLRTAFRANNQLLSKPSAGRTADEQTNRQGNSAKPLPSASTSSRVNSLDKVYFVSAADPTTVAELKQAIEENLPRSKALVDVVLPLTESKLVNLAYTKAEVIRCQWTEAGIELKAYVNEDLADKILSRAIS